MNITFFGSDDFALEHLKTIVDSEHVIKACVTQPDRPRGRGLHVIESPIKTWAREARIPVLQPENLKDDEFVSKLKGLNSDIFVVIAYGKILPEAILEIPKLYAINVHGSLLPKYRGAAPINWVIINGDKETGVTIIKMNKNMDAGEIISQRKMVIDGQDTSVTLRKKMIEEGKDLLIDTLEKINDQTARFTSQDKNLVTIAPKLNREMGKIEWDKKVSVIHNLVRGLLPWPSAYTFFDGKMLKILETQIISTETTGKYKPGAVSYIGKDGFSVTTKDGELLVKRVHFENAKPMLASEFIVGHKIVEGYRFNSQ